MKWGVISTAKIGTEKVIPAMQESDKLEILAIAGRDLEKTRETAQSLRIPRAFAPAARPGLARRGTLVGGGLRSTRCAQDAY